MFSGQSSVCSETLQISSHFRRERQVLCVESFNLIYAGPSVLCEIEYIDIAFRQNDPHTYRCMPKRINRTIAAGNLVALKSGSFKHGIKLTCYDAGYGTDEQVEYRTFLLNATLNQLPQ
jgi:hypothetical protein